ncbi:hypothetical protein K501DRAFT_18319 [Backusella circina FSU 941]|nr:hypothetical protein K501DRAFT_18319 [Backusella circina FSU 941]
MDENGQVRYLGKSSGYYLLQNSKTYQNGAFHFGTYGNKPKKRKPSRVDPFELPPKDLSEHLIILYFTHFYPFLPLFFKRQLYSIDPIAPLLLNAIYAIASRISPDPRVRSDPASASTAGDVFFDRAERLLDESYDQPSISTVQALLLLSIHQHGAMKSARAWLYSGMAFRMAQDLGLHRNCDHWNIPPDECERRKRVFWCCFIVDRLSSAMYGRATTFEPKDCDVPFPSVDDTEPIPDSNISILDTFIHLIRICDILGHVLKNIYYVRSLQNMTQKQVEQVLTTWNRKLHQWSSQLPESLNPNSSHLPTAVCQLHMIYHTTVILLHRPFLQSNQSLIQNPLPSSSVCVSAADSILSMVSSLLAENRIKYVLNYAVYFVFTAGITFIKTASSNKSLDYKGKVDKIMQVLDEIEYTWTTASKNCQILAEISGFPEVHPSPITQSFLPHTATLSSAGSSPKRQNTSNLRFPTLQLGLTHTIDNSERPLYSSPTHDFGMQFQSNNQTSTMDPFAAPGIIPNLSRQYFTESEPYIQDRTNLEEYQENKGLIHNDPHVDVLSGVSEQTSLLDYVPPMNDGRPSYNEISNGFYW